MTENLKQHRKRVAFERVTRPHPWPPDPCEVRKALLDSLRTKGPQARFVLDPSPVPWESLPLPPANDPPAPDLDIPPEEGPETDPRF